MTSSEQSTIVLLSWRPIESVHREEMTTPYPSFDTNDEPSQPHHLAPQPPPPPAQHQQPSQNIEQDPYNTSDNPQQVPQFNSRTMSPRIPRKRPNYNSKDEEYEGDFELEKTAISPNSGAGRSYSGMEVVSAEGGSFRHRNQANWNIDIEREDEIPLSPENRRHEPDYEEPNEKRDKNKHRTSGVDVSLYTTKKNVAQGMLDIALLSANCSQLKYLLFHYERDSSSLTSVQTPNSPQTSSMMNWFTSMDFYFIVNLICIALSIGLQIIVGILLIMNGRHNIYVHRYQRVADNYSNLILCTVFIITIVNIFLSVFISAR